MEANRRKAMFRAAIVKMAPYVPGEQPKPGQRLIKLNTNENPYPPSPQVGRAIARAAAGSRLRLYPAPRADEFVASATRLYRMPTRMILAGNGSDELLAMLFRATLGRGDKVAYPSPTYSLYDTLAAIQEARAVRIPFPSDFSLPVEELARAGAKLTVICNPNSPSGTFTPIETLDALSRRLEPRLIAIDEAYVDFADDNALRLVKRRPNVIVLRTLSKSFSLAGMRLGLCFARPDVTETLMKVKDSYNLSRVALAAGAAALDDAGWMRRNVERIRSVRVITERALIRLGFQVPPSSANFVLARLAGRDLTDMTVRLRRRGLLVRHFATAALGDALRISIGTPREMRALFKALESLVPLPTRALRNSDS
jgi:histidinol-phosphate aminotransferase